MNSASPEGAVPEGNVRQAVRTGLHLNFVDKGKGPIHSDCCPCHDDNYEFSHKAGGE